MPQDGFGDIIWLVVIIVVALFQGLRHLITKALKQAPQQPGPGTSPPREVKELFEQLFGPQQRRDEEAQPAAPVEQMAARPAGRRLTAPGGGPPQPAVAAEPRKETVAERHLESRLGRKMKVQSTSERRRGGPATVQSILKGYPRNSMARAIVLSEIVGPPVSQRR